MWLALSMALTLSQGMPQGIGSGWTGELEHAANQLIALAEATPEEQFAFRPAPGVRSTREVYLHVAWTNYWLLAQAGAKTGGAHWPNEIPADLEKKALDKAEILKWLKDSFAAVLAAQGSFDATKVVSFAGRNVPASSVMLRLLVHNHEHMGQVIAYARMSGVIPPWSRSQ
jgi:uncharacterized damage-inducible protein DinB